MANVVAQQGDAFLVEIADGFGQVVDREDGTISPLLPVDSVMARGYWEDTDTPLSEVLRDISGRLATEEEARKAKAAREKHFGPGAF